MAKPNFSELLLSIGYDHTGKNFVLDKGMPHFIYEAYIESLHDYIQVVKLGWTTWSLFQDAELRKKLLVAERHNIPVCLGGTLFEISYRQGNYPDLLKFLSDMNIRTIEIASGFSVEVAELPDAIALAKKEGLSVMVEVGYKDQERDQALSIDDRVAHVRSAKNSGADFVILEAREVGKGYSVFNKDEAANTALLQSILQVMPLEQIVFEAPTRDNQIDLVNTLGPNINMGNLPFEEVPRVETIRRGLHADTYESIQKLKLGGK